MSQTTSSPNLGQIAAGAAVGLVAGLAIPHARKAVMQAPSIVAGDWVKALTAEHDMVRKTFDLLLKTNEGEMAKRELLLTKIAYALTKHAIEEENVIYPALAEHARADDARHLTEDHAEAKTFIYDLRRISSRDPQWILKARELHEALLDHMREEEQEVFPAFHQALSSDDNAKLTKMMNWEGFKAA